MINTIAENMYEVDEQDKSPDDNQTKSKKARTALPAVGTLIAEADIQQ